MVRLGGIGSRKSDVLTPENGYVITEYIRFPLYIAFLRLRGCTV